MRNFYKEKRKYYHAVQYVGGNFEECRQFCLDYVKRVVCIEDNAKMDDVVITTEEALEKVKSIVWQMGKNEWIVCHTDDDGYPCIDCRMSDFFTKDFEEKN